MDHIIARENIGDRSSSAEKMIFWVDRNFWTMLWPHGDFNVEKYCSFLKRTYPEELHLPLTVNFFQTDFYTHPNCFEIFQTLWTTCWVKIIIKRSAILNVLDLVLCIVDCWTIEKKKQEKSSEWSEILIENVFFWFFLAMNYLNNLWIGTVKKF